MLEYTPLQRIRQFVSRVPGAARLYDRIRLSFAASYREDGLVTTHNCDFTKDPQFQAAYASGERQQAMDGIRWRTHVALWAAFHAKQLEGDFVECGVWRGGNSIIAADIFKRYSPHRPPVAPSPKASRAAATVSALAAVAGRGRTGAGAASSSAVGSR